MSFVTVLQPPPSKYEAVQKKIFSLDFLEFFEKLFNEIDTRIDELYKNRLKVKYELKFNSNLKFKKSNERRDKNWKIAPLPERLKCRRLDLGDVSPSNTAHFVDALNSDVQGIQVDFDDGHCPTWLNQILSYNNIYMCVNGNLNGAPLNINTCPVLMMRPRAWNIIEHNVMVRGKEVPGSLLDFAVLVYHNGRKLYETSSGPYFYLSKLEGSKEAQLWNDIFVWTQNYLDIPQGTIKVCVLIENIISTFELEEIIYALKEHMIGLNCGIWDYAASIIAKLGDRREYLIPDRNKYVNMDRTFLNSYMKLVISVCHERSAMATGGMAAQILKAGTDGTDNESKRIIQNVLKAKMKEIEYGVDGFMVYDLRLVQHVNQLWKNYTMEPNQIGKKLKITVTPEELLTIPEGGVTLDGVRHNVAITILFVYYWLAGIGHFFYNGCVEDSATAEISRSQIWQWIRFSPPVEGDPSILIDVYLIDRIASEFAQKAYKNLCRSSYEKKRLTAARYMSMELFCTREFPDFITTYLNDNHKFRTLHNKSLLNKL